MVIDTSAIMAILQDEPERHAFSLKIEADEVRLFSVASYVEASMVLEMRNRAPGAIELDNFLSLGDFTLVPVDVDQARAAARAFRQFGKGRHPARLNYGDCFAYALAVTSNEPLLFKGTDFELTDVLVA